MRSPLLRACLLNNSQFSAINIRTMFANRNTIAFDEMTENVRTATEMGRKTKWAGQSFGKSLSFSPHQNRVYIDRRQRSGGGGGMRMRMRRKRFNEIIKFTGSLSLCADTSHSRDPELKRIFQHSHRFVWPSNVENYFHVFGMRYRLCHTFDLPPFCSRERERERLVRPS